MQLKFKVMWFKLNQAKQLKLKRLTRIKFKIKSLVPGHKEEVLVIETGVQALSFS